MTAHAENASAAAQRHAARGCTPSFTRLTFGHDVRHRFGATLQRAGLRTALTRLTERLNRFELAMTRPVECDGSYGPCALIFDDRMSSLVAGCVLLGITPESGCLVNLRNPRRRVARGRCRRSAIPVRGRQRQGVARSAIPRMPRDRVGRDDSDRLRTRITRVEAGEGEDTECLQLTC
jgi:hypothetical protein